MERRLAAILYADVAGYSRLVGADEEGTHPVFRAHFDALVTTIEAQGGRIVHTAGDAVLAEFSSVVWALQAAVLAQREMAERNKELPEERNLQFRIGVNLGDVIIDGKEIYGNGVNVAARIESLAEAGGISISGRVFEQVKGNVDVGFACLGAQTVKNIEAPVNVYKVLLDPADAGKIINAPKSKAPQTWRWAAACFLLVAAAVGGSLWFYLGKPEFEPAAVENMALPLPDKPSIAVLPFKNFSDDPKQEYFVDGMTDDLITDLSKISGLFVISRNSVFVYKDKPVEIRQVAEELGVRYVLEGSVRRAGDQVRVNAQLIDATNGGHLWAERYDAKLTDVFALQDAVTERVVEALELRLTEKDKDRRSHEQRTDSLEAYDLVLRARKLLTRFDRKAAAEAKELLEQAIELDPNYTEAYSLLGLYYFDAWRLWGESRGDNLSRALDFAQVGIKLDPLDPAPHVLSAQVYQFRREFDAASAEVDAALKLSPNDALTLANLGSMLRYANRPAEAAEAVERAVRLDPFHPPNYMEWLGDAYFLLGRYDDCAEAVERGMALNPDFIAFYVVGAKCYAARNDEKKANDAVANILRIYPRFTLKAFASYVPFSKEEALQHNVDMLRKAGVPE